MDHTCIGPGCAYCTLSGVTVLPPAASPAVPCVGCQGAESFGGWLDIPAPPPQSGDVRRGE
jgi:hypothetical protein